MQKGINKMTNKIIMDTNVAAKAATPVQECKEEELDLQKEQKNLTPATGSLSLWRERI